MLLRQQVTVLIVASRSVGESLVPINAIVAALPETQAIVFVASHLPRMHVIAKNGPQRGSLVCEYSEHCETPGDIQLTSLALGTCHAL